MADPSLGLTFAPTAQNPSAQGSQRPPTGGGGSASPIQEAIRVLSLRLPQVIGAQAPTSAALLRSQPVTPTVPRGAGMPNLGIEDLLRRLFGGMLNLPQSTPGAPPSGGPIGPLSAPANPFPYGAIDFGANVVQNPANAIGSAPTPRVEYGVNGNEGSGGGGDPTNPGAAPSTPWDWLAGPR